MVLLSLFSLAVFGGCLGGGKSKIEAVGKVDHHEELKKIMDKMGRVTDRTLSSLGGKRLTEKEISYVGHMAAGTSLIFCEEGEKRKEMLANLALVKGQESNERKELEFVTPPTEEAVEKALKEIKNFTKSKVKDDEIRRFLKIIGDTFIKNLMKVLADCRLEQQTFSLLPSLPEIWWLWKLLWLT